MVENDIYNSKRSYETLKNSIPELHKVVKKRKYHCQNKKNLKYFHKLCDYLEAKDLSYVRRLRLIASLKFITFCTKKELSKCERNDINQIMAIGHQKYKTPESKKTFIKHFKYLWKVLFPVLDEKGLPDERLTPHSVRHLSEKIDKSRQKRRKDRLTVKEFEMIIDYFVSDPRMQAYLSIALESLGRPQEILYVKIKDCEIFDNYAKISLNGHTKEGIGILQCIDSHPYLLKWLNHHPVKNNPESYLFVNERGPNRVTQLKPHRINQLIRQACKALKIDKPVTCYSLKRNGVTFRRLRGDSDVQIQHAARWTSTKQLKTYDQSDQQDAFKMELIKRGYIEDDSEKFTEVQKPKVCIFCEKINRHSNVSCDTCKRPLDRKKIREEAEMRENQFEKYKEEIKLSVMSELDKKLSTNSVQNDIFTQHPEIKELIKMISELHKFMSKLS